MTASATIALCDAAVQTPAAAAAARRRLQRTPLLRALLLRTPQPLLLLVGVLLVTVATAGAPALPMSAAPPAQAPAATTPPPTGPGLHPAFGGSSQRLRDFLRRLPKAELHLHIEGTLEVDLLFRLARRNGVQLDYPDEAAARAARSNYTCLEDFLKLFSDIAVLQTEQDYFDLAAAYLARAHAAGVRHAELHFDAQGQLVRGIPFEAVYRGLARAIAASPVDASLILTFERSKSLVDAGATMAVTLEYLKEGLIKAVGLAGPEAGNPPGRFEDVYFAARALGLNRTAHAGEEGGPEYVADAIKLLGVERIDHGIRALEDPELVAVMVDFGIPITLCPISNLRLQVYRGQLEERIRQMLGSGIMVTINSDDPAYFGGYINENFEWVAGIAGLGPEALAQLAANSFEASFLPPESRAAYVREVWRELDAWKAEQGQAGQQPIEDTALPHQQQE